MSRGMLRSTEKTTKWIVKIKIWANIKGWWDSDPIKIKCSSKEEAEKVRDEYETKIKRACSLHGGFTKIGDMNIQVNDIKAFKIKIIEPETNYSKDQVDQIKETLEQMNHGEY